MGNLQEDDDLENTVRISARRFDESPFISKLDSKNMIRGVYAGRFHAIYNGENVLEKYWVLRKKAILFDVPEKPVQISGPDAKQLLNKVLARDISKIEEGRGYFALACSPNGGIFMDGVVFKIEENKYWYVQADGNFETWLLAHSEDLDVKITDPNSRVLQIQGPNSLKIMNLLTKGKIDETMKYYRSGFYTMDGQILYVSRSGFTGELGFEIYTLGEKTDHNALWDFIFEIGKKYGLEFSSTRSITIRRIEAGILGNLTDMDITMTPFEAGLGKFVDLEKKYFVGKKKLMSADKRTLLFGFKCNNFIPSAGSKIYQDDNFVGIITAGVDSPTLKCGIGFVRFLSPGDWVNKELKIIHPNKTEGFGSVVELPFFDKEKKLLLGK